jgi:predicted Zn finger-like uncharacterized protein
MAMLTTCPACRTRFRVTPEQLGAHRGDVRCGRCAKVFNAHAYLEYESEVLEPEAFEPEDELDAEVEGDAEEAWPPEENASPQIEAVEESLDKDLSKSPAPASVHVETAAAETSEPEISALLELATPEILPEEPIGSPFLVKETENEIPPAREEDVPKKRGFRWLWLFGAFLLLASLAGQGLYFFRAELVLRYPDFKPFLQQLCGCTILPANPDLLSIETSNLEADPNQANLVALNAILRNRAKVAQEYPLLELTLTDTQDQMIARRIFPPGEYAKKADLKRGMPPNEEVTVKLYLDLGDLKAAGYRVFLFYPQ